MIFHLAFKHTNSQTNKIRNLHDKLASLVTQMVKRLPACRAGDPCSIPGSGRCPGEGNGNPLQYSCLENSMDRGAWQATVHGVAKSQTRLNNCHSSLTHDQLLNHKLCFRSVKVLVTQSIRLFGISQTRTLEWVAISFSRGSSQPRDRTQVPCISGRFFTT